jgi:hypothetical protein
MPTLNSLKNDIISFHRDERMTRSASSPKKWVKYLLLFLGLGILAASIANFAPRYIYRYWGYLWLNKFESRLTEQQLQEIQKGLQGLKGKMVWSSSRTGNHEIFLLTLPDLKMYQLTHNPHVNTFPRFSPDGEKIAFCRSQPRWVSQRNLELWDVYVLSLADNKETLLARNAFTPQWINSQQLSFVRKNQLIIKDLKTLKEEIVLDGDKRLDSSQMTTPEFLRSDPKMLALTLRGKLDGVFVWDRQRDSLIRFGAGCQISWFPSGREVLWINNGGNGGTEVVKSLLINPKQEVFMDLPGAYSHEYFPRLSQDGKWLVWAAAAEGHEPDVVDYEIFVWSVGTPFSKAIRLTYNRANDNWPDIFTEQ